MFSLYQDETISQVGAFFIMLRMATEDFKEDFYKIAGHIILNLQPLASNLLSHR